MAHHVSRSVERTDGTRPLLLWVFRRHFDAITCGVAVNASGDCEVRVVPEWDPSLAIVQRFDNTGDALRHHAQIARHLREIGWSVADHVPVLELAA